MNRESEPTPRGQDATRECPVCGTLWEPDPYTIRRAPYCSRLCELSAVLPVGPGSVRQDLRKALEA